MLPQNNNQPIRRFHNFKQLVRDMFPNVGRIEENALVLSDKLYGIMATAIVGTIIFEISTREPTPELDRLIEKLLLAANSAEIFGIINSIIAIAFAEFPRQRFMKIATTISRILSASALAAATAIFFVKENPENIPPIIILAGMVEAVGVSLANLIYAVTRPGSLSDAARESVLEREINNLEREARFFEQNYLLNIKNHVAHVIMEACVPTAVFLALVLGFPNAGYFGFALVFAYGLHTAKQAIDALGNLIGNILHRNDERDVAREGYHNNRVFNDRQVNDRTEAPTRNNQDAEFAIPPPTV